MSSPGLWGRLTHPAPSIPTGGRWAQGSGPALLGCVQIPCKSDLAKSERAPLSSLQVRCLHGQEDRRPRLCPAGGRGGGEAQDGDDRVCLPDGPRAEARLKSEDSQPALLPTPSADARLKCSAPLPERWTLFG